MLVIGNLIQDDVLKHLNSFLENDKMRAELKDPVEQESKKTFFGHNSTQ